MQSHFNAYLRHRYVVDNISPKTQADIRSRLGTFTPPVPLAKVTRRHVVTWMDQISHLSPATRRAYFSTLRRFMRWAVEEDRIAKDPTRGLRGPKVPATPPKHLNEHEVRALIDTASRDLRTLTIVVVLLQMGLRRGELAAVRVEDIDPGERTMWIRGKGGGGEITRSVPIPDEAWMMLRRYQAVETVGRGRHGPLLRSRLDPTVGITGPRISEIVTEAMVDAGVKLPGDSTRTTHSTRHTAAVDMLRHGVDLRSVQHVLGHASMRTTEDFYVRGAGLDLRPAVEGREYLSLNTAA
jgi:integrase/recombinase XerC